MIRLNISWEMSQNVYWNAFIISLVVMIPVDEIGTIPQKKKNKNTSCDVIDRQSLACGELLNTRTLSTEKEGWFESSKCRIS